MRLFLLLLTSCTINFSEVENEGGTVTTDERSEQNVRTNAELTPKLFGLF